MEPSSCYHRLSQNLWDLKGLQLPAKSLPCAHVCVQALHLVAPTKENLSIDVRRLAGNTCGRLRSWRKW